MILETNRLLPIVQAQAPIWSVLPSSIHGLGLFSLADISAGQLILPYRGRLLSNEEARGVEIQRQAAGSKVHYLLRLDEETVLDGDGLDNPAKYANHSCRPNCEMVLVEKRPWLAALRPINAGEELTFDYGYGLAEALEHRCHCGAPGCPGYIVAGPWRWKFKVLQPRRSRTNKMARGS